MLQTDGKICWRNEVNNETVWRNVSGQFTVVGFIKERKLKLFGHICRMETTDWHQDGDAGNGARKDKPRGRLQQGDGLTVTTQWTGRVWLLTGGGRQYNWRMSGEESLSLTTNKGHELMMMIIIIIIIIIIFQLPSSASTRCFCTTVFCLLTTRISAAPDSNFLH